jgi:archaemetzincin
MRIFLLLLSVLFFKSCSFKTPENTPSHTPNTINQQTIVLQPFKGIDSGYINYLKNNIRNYYNVRINVVAVTALPRNAFNGKRSRYTADSLLQFLKSMSPTQGVYVLGVTAKDISTYSNGIADWGIMGLGYQPGNAAVASTYRLTKKIGSLQQVYTRLLKVSVHELGHNFGLPHCANQTCIMVDAAGKNKLDEEEYLCEKCRFFLYKNGFIKKGVTGL